MNISFGKWLLDPVLLLAFGPQNDVAAQSKNLEHTYKLDEGGDRPAATLEDVAWMAGSWTGRTGAQAKS